MFFCLQFHFLSFPRVVLMSCFELRVHEMCGCIDSFPECVCVCAGVFLCPVGD